MFSRTIKSPYSHSDFEILNQVGNLSFNIPLGSIDVTVPQTIDEKLLEIIKHAALSRIRLQTNRDNFQIVDLTDILPGQVFGRWMAIILISGKSLRITFKVHFNYKDAKYLAAGSPKTPKTVEDKYASDFIKEFANLTAGYIKMIFEECGILLGISLSLCTRGYYEVFTDLDAEIQENAWKLDSPEATLTCSAELEPYDLNELEAV